MHYPYFVVDAFTSDRFSGNPAAVVLDADGLADGDMQRIAAEFNLSETTFVLTPDRAPVADPPVDSGAAAPTRFRWFTPTVEVGMCGHATVAGAHAMLEAGRLPPVQSSETIRLAVDTRSGWLGASIEPLPGRSGRMIWLDLVAPALTPVDLNLTELATILALGPDAFDASLPPARTQDGDALVFVTGTLCLNDAKPEWSNLAAWLNRASLRGLCLATVNTVTPSLAVQSRFFAPTVGVNEDPVTGSVHGPLAAYLVGQGRVPSQGGLAGMMCGQGVAGGRGGIVNALVQTHKNGHHTVRIGGTAVTVMRGTLCV